MVIRVRGTTGKLGKSGAKPTNGTNGGDASTGQNGGIVSAGLAFQAIGGHGGTGGSGTTGNGANGGNGGNASVNINGNIVQPTTKTVTISGQADGGLGGNGGAGAIGFNAGNGGKGGNATVAINGNIIQTSTKMTNITIDAKAIAGAGGTGFVAGADGNASATINGNIVNYNGSTPVTASLTALAEVVGNPDTTANDGDLSFGTKTATINGNILQGNINKADLIAQAEFANGLANINGNIIQTRSTAAGDIFVEATGQHISITNNKFNLGPQELDLALNELGPSYDTKISGNSFVGTGNNQFNLSATYNPGPSTDTAVINLATGAFLFDGGVNTLSKFGSVSLAGDIQGSLIGTSGNNGLSAANDTSAGTIVFNGNGGTDTITGGPNALNVAYFAGREAQYTITGALPGTNAAPVSVTGGPTGQTSNDTLTGIQRLKFLAPTHVSDIDNDGNSDLIFQNGTTGNLQIRLEGTPVVAENITGVGASLKAIGTGQFTADTDRTAGILLQNNTTGALEVITGITPGATPPSTTASITTPLTLPTGLSTAGWTAISAGDFNGDGASDVLLQNSSTGAAEILFLNSKAGEAIGTVDSVGSVAAPSGAGWKAISSGDFNGDGNSDILWQNTNTGQTDVYLMNGSTIASSTTLNPGANFTAIGTGDFNGDGNSDIVFLNNTDHSAQIWTMNGNTEIGSPINVPQPTPTAPQTNFVLLGAEDVNGDGFSDLLWQDTTTGNVKATEFTTGGAVLQTVNLGAPNASFHLVASTGGG